MSRLKKYSRSLASGYFTLGANILFTLASVPLALHYLSREEFGLWALVTQVASCLQMIELGISGSIYRILIDHKDRPDDGGYGAVLRTGVLVLLIQGAIIAGAGVLLSFWLPALLKVPLQMGADFRWLVMGQCVLTGGLFSGRVFSLLLQAHQRTDVSNHVTTLVFVLTFAVQWAGFACGLGLYGLLVANVVSALASVGFTWWATARLRLYPKPQCWGRLDKRIFMEMFRYGSELFLLSVGLQLINASQAVIIKLTLGLEAVAVWSVATKIFTLAQQCVARVWDFSAAAISEMIVRDERARLRRRFQEISLVTASLAVFTATGVAACNSSLLALWTKGQISWSITNDVLMATLIVVNSITRVHIGLTGQTKKIRGMRYIYFFEGLSFVALALWATPFLGFTGLIASALAMNIVWSWIYAVRRTAEEFQCAPREVGFAWLAVPGGYAAMLIPLAVLCVGATGSLPHWVQLTVNAAFSGIVGGGLLWKFGITPGLRAEVAPAFTKLRARLWPVS